jgi:hypothetical protein
MTDRSRRLVVSLVVLLALVGCTGAQSPTPSGSSVPSTPTGSPGPVADYGDAPDPGFPSLFASNGARALDIAKIWLGDLASPSVTAEDDANVVDLDPLDDGLEAIEGESGGPGLTFRAVKSASAATGVEYFNLLVDLDRDGRWSGADWVTVNRAVPLAPGESVLVASDVPNTALFDTWIRATLTSTPVNASLFPDGWDGTGEFAVGEVEDYLFPLEGPPPTPPPTPPYYTPTPYPIPTPSASPIIDRTPVPASPTPSPSPKPSFVYSGVFMPACDAASILHGESVFVPIRLLYGEPTPPERFHAEVAPYMATGETQVTTSPPSDTVWAPWGAGAGFTFTSTQVDPPERVETWPVWVIVQSRAITRLLNCTVQVRHVTAAPTVRIEPTVLTRGGATTLLVLNLTGAGFTPNGHVTLTAVPPSGSRESAKLLADARGNVATPVFIPPNGPAGSWTLLVRDDTTGAIARAPFTVK